MGNGEELLTVAEVAARLRVTRVTVHRWIQQGRLAAIVLPGAGRVRRIPASAVDAITNGTAPPA